MIRDEKLAAAISDLMLDVNAKLNQSIRQVMERAEHEEFIQYRRGVGAIMYEVLELLDRIYQEHPTIRPHPPGPQ